MKEINIISSVQSYYHYNTSSLFVSFFVFNQYNIKINFYSYNPPLNVISLINNTKEDAMSFKHNNINFIKKTLLIAIMLSFSSFAFSQETKANVNKNITITIMPFYGLENMDRYFIANLLSTKLTNFTVTNIDSKILNDSSIYSNMTAEQYTNFMFLNSKYIKTDYILLAGIIIENGYPKCFLSIIDTKMKKFESILDNVLIADQEQPGNINYALECIIREVSKYCSIDNILNYGRNTLY